MKTLIRVGTVLAVLVHLPAPSYAQAPVLAPGQVFALEVEAGQMVGPAGTLVPRPEANVVIQYRLGSNATPTDMVKRAPCTPVTAGSNTYTCHLIPPAMPAGAQVIAFRSRTQPAETGINPSDWTAPFGFTVAIVTATGLPSNVRVISVP